MEVRSAGEEAEQTVARQSWASDKMAERLKKTVKQTVARSAADQESPGAADSRRAADSRHVLGDGDAAPREVVPLLNATLPEVPGLDLVDLCRRKQVVPTENEVVMGPTRIQPGACLSSMPHRMNLDRKWT